MRNLIVCCDGTWNDPNNEDDEVPAPTNVRKLFEAIDLDGDNPSQLSRYQSGVGTGGLVDKVMGGMVGYGLGEDIRDCYQWLSDKYQHDDRLYLFGFSRGAFTARSLAGMIGRYGLIDFSRHPGQPRDSLVKQVYRKGYRNGEVLDEGIHFHPDSCAVAFVGVWDTVGALGIPNDKSLLNIFDNPEKYQFHNVALGDHIGQARHAVALNEKRGSFTPTLWKSDRTDGSLKQLWFPGVHSDVGGGYKETGLSDGALEWMIQEAKEQGVVLSPPMLQQIKPDPQGLEHDSHVGAMKALVSAPRSIPDLDHNRSALHASVTERRRRAPLNQGRYLPTRAFNGQPIEIDIYAKHPWNWTGIFLEAGQCYRFSATGEWMDASIPASPKGTEDGDFHKGEIIHLAGKITGLFESGFKKLFGNQQANFFGTKRIEHADWFCLMGAIADGGNPGVDGTHEPLYHFEIGEQAQIRVERSGYLYCFANDAWGFYGNNRGYVTLMVEQVQASG
ncbi:DUF2235 domain-containing protein [Motiliproteus sp.]|uniref:DUF2235 domain-containing protein n=1 Tax=Motiliproteus sp. TaxID=1898955 RepID=UPI003BABEDF7